MALNAFKEFVETHEELFRGYSKESLTNIEQAETELQVSLPESMTWLLTNYGYWKGTGLPSLQWIVGTTKRMRTKLANEHIVLGYSATKSQHVTEKTGQLALMLMNTPQGNILELCETGEGWKITPRFASFEEYVVKNIEHMLPRQDEAQKTLPTPAPAINNPVEISQGELPLLSIQHRVGEAITWNTVREEASLAVDQLSCNFPQLVSLVTQERLTMLMKKRYHSTPYYHYSSSSLPYFQPAKELISGRLLVNEIGSGCMEETHLHELMCKLELPSPDYWISLFSDTMQTKDTAVTYWLLSWIPDEAISLYQQHIEQNPQFNFWLDAWNHPVRDELIKHNYLRCA